jgi:phenylalanyl-tRNA synthetase beta chain
MKVSLNLAQRYADVDLKGLNRDEIVNRLGLQLGAIEEVIDWGARYKGIVVAKVIACVDHPDSDHMHICMLDDGGVVEDVERDKDGLVQVVCGAPNVAAGQTVAWLAPGSTVPASYNDSELFVLGKRELRGHISNGMIGSAKELAIGDSHDGILEINVSSFESPDVAENFMKPGTPFVDLYDLDDLIIDCENKMFTHRPDCFGNIGVAREIAAISHLTFTSPEWYLNKPQFNKIADVKIDVFNDTKEKVPRIMAVAMKNVKVGPSPAWLQSALTRMGGKPINNVVDVSNFVMYLTGQPTHAYDLSKINGATIGARYAKEAEKISLLNGKTVVLNKEDIVISDQNGAVGIAGVMGGSDSEVSDATTDILLEVATFNMYVIRKTAMRHGLFTDAFTRFSKGQSPLQNDRVLAKFMKLLADITGAEQSSEVADLRSDLANQLFDRQFVHEPIRITADFINSRLGSNLSAEEISQLLENVEMSIDSEGDELVVTAPFWRTDIELKEDIVEEVGRLYGYEKLPIVLPTRLMKPTKRNSMQDLKSAIRSSLKQAGANEVLTYSFVHGDLMRKSGVDPDKWAYHLRNAISPDLQYYRTTVIASLLDKIQMNIRADFVRADDNEFALFEIGKAHAKGHESFDSDDIDNRTDKQKLPDEFTRLAFIFAADEKTAAAKYQGSAYYEALKYLKVIMTDSVELIPCETNEYPVTSVYQIGRSACIMNNGAPMGMIGEIREDIKKKLKLPAYSAGFEIDLSIFAQMQKQNGYQPIGTYPKTQQDITFKVHASKTYEELRSTIWAELQKAHEANSYEVSMVLRDIFQKDGEETKNITFRIWLNHSHKTLKTEEVNKLLDVLSTEMKQKLGAERI